MVLDFIGNQALYLALARGSAEPLARALREFPAIPPSASLGRFVRNHDELTLDKLSEEERAEVFARFGADPDAAALRPRPAPAAADDARRRRARDPDGLLARVLAPRHAGAVLRRGDRHGREPRDRGPLQRPRPDAVVAGRRLHDLGRAPAADGRGRVRPRPDQRRRPAPRPRLAAELVRAPDPAPPRVPGARASAS